MAQAINYTKTGAKKDAPVKLSSKVFGAKPNQELVALAYRAYQSNRRSAGAKTLSRGEVRGGGKKPYRQKGTGRARAGSSRIPHWTGGGVVFGPTGNENYRVNLPSKLRQAAIRHALSLKADAKKVHVIEAFDSADGKVKPTLSLLEKLKFSGEVLVVVSDKGDLVDRATRNIPAIKLVQASYLNVYDIINADDILISQTALELINKRLETAS